MPDNYCIEEILSRDLNYKHKDVPKLSGHIFSLSSQKFKNYIIRVALLLKSIQK